MRIGRKKKETPTQIEVPTIETSNDDILDIELADTPLPPPKPPVKELTPEEKELLDYLEQYRQFSIHHFAEFQDLTPATIHAIKADQSFLLWKELRQINEKLEEMKEQ